MLHCGTPTCSVLLISESTNILLMFSEKLLLTLRNYELSDWLTSCPIRRLLPCVDSVQLN